MWWVASTRSDTISILLQCDSPITFIAPTEAPVTVTANAINASRISVSWTKPNKSVLHGNLSQYEVEYMRVECNESDPVSVIDGSWKIVNVSSASLNVEIGNLAFWSCFDVRMRAVTVGNGPYSSTIKVRTKEHGEPFSLFCLFFLDNILRVMTFVKE